VGRTIPDNRQSVFTIASRELDEKLVPIAQDIAIERAAAICEAMFHMAAIRSLQRRPDLGASALVECVGALVQDRTAAEGHQAAHLLPGQIRVGTMPVWALAAAGADCGIPAVEIERLEARTQSSFASTRVLPAVFNRADSQAEKLAGFAGLKPLFAATVRQLWQGVRTDGSRPLAIDRGAVLASLGAWFKTVNGVYETASGRKLDAWVAADTRGRLTADDRHREADILATYADSFKIYNIARFISAHAPHVDGWYHVL
jgi:hypothetical protein